MDSSAGAVHPLAFHKVAAREVAGEVDAHGWRVEERGGGMVGVMVVGMGLGG